MRDVRTKQLLDPLDRRLRVFNDVVEQTGSDRHDIQFHVRQEVRDFERVHQIRLAGMTDLSLVLEGREHIGSPEQFDVGLGVGAPDLFDQVLEPNHDWRCLNRYRGLLTRCFWVHYTGPVRAPAILSA